MLEHVCNYLPVFLFREDWKPVLTVNSIVYGLQYLFLVSGKKNKKTVYENP